MIEPSPDILRIIDEARGDGWVLENAAKRLFSLAGFAVPRFTLARTAEEALGFAHEIGYPVVSKIVSPRILHKSDVGGVVVGIGNDGRLAEVFERFRGLDGFLGVLVEEMISGIELILGAKIDLQFGPMILLGMGGTAVEIYQDVALRMAPLTEKDVLAMIEGLKARRLLEGYRGAEPVNKGKLTETILAFSALVMELEGRIESVDINPLLCSAGRCVVADARIILSR
jgi:acetate---CoA ligase (ADP-forming) subunit beta